MKSTTKYIRISPKKLNLISSLVRGMKVSDALNTLKYTPKKGAGILAKALQSAASNAENNFKQDIENLYIKEVFATSGPTLKRRLAVSRGRAHPILKRTSHLKITLDVKIEKEEKNVETPIMTSSDKIEKTKKQPKKS